MSAPLPPSMLNWQPHPSGHGWLAPGTVPEPPRPDVGVRALAGLAAVLKLAELAAADTAEYAGILPEHWEPPDTWAG